MNKKVLLGGVSIITFVIAGEICLREFLGMCDAPLYQESDK